MCDTLKELGEEYNVIGIKAEFEAEGTRLEEALRLKEIVTKAGLDLTIKIGGCEAVKDMFDAKTIGCGSIVGPMIETAYAMKKYVKTAAFVFPPAGEENVDFYINIETITGFENFDEIVSAPEFEKVSGIVLGRVDMTGSLGMTRDDVNSPRIFEMANKMSLKMRELGKAMVIGGGVSADSLPFFRNIEGRLDKFETRKVVFDAQKALASDKSEDGLIKAVGFELMWLKNKRDFYGAIYCEDEARIKMLETRYGNLMKKAGANHK